MTVHMIVVNDWNFAIKFIRFTNGTSAILFIK